RRLLEAENRGDIRVMELGEELGLALEARQALGVAEEGLGEQLDRHLAPQARVRGAIDPAHPALAELASDLVGAEPDAGLELHDAISGHTARLCSSAA